MASARTLIVTLTIVTAIIAGPSVLRADEPQRLGGTTLDDGRQTSALVRGEVLEIEGSAYVVRDPRGREVRLPVDQDTRFEHTPKVGDEIVAQVAEDGRSRSIRSMSAGLPDGIDTGSHSDDDHHISE